MNINLKQYYKTSDIALATTLSLIHKIDSIDKTIPRRAEFTFIATVQLHEAIRKYWNKELRIEPRQYFDQLKALKAQLYAHE